MTDTHDLTLERVARLGRDVAALTESISSMTRLFAQRLDDISARLDRIEVGQREQLTAMKARITRTERWIETLENGCRKLLEGDAHKLRSYVKTRTNPPAPEPFRMPPSPKTPMPTLCIVRSAARISTTCASSSPHWGRFSSATNASICARRWCGRNAKARRGTAANGADVTALLRSNVAFTITMVAVAGALVALLWWPSKWDRATVVKICRNGTPILRVDGQYWARRSVFVRYRVDNPETVCG